MRIVLAAFAVIASVAGHAAAQEEAPAPPSSPPTTQVAPPFENQAPSTPPRSSAAPAEETQSVTPNRKLLWASVIAFGAGYVPSVIVAAVSSNDSDRYLLIPVAGPWIDLALRSCAAPASVSCSNSTWNGVGLFVDGLLQLAGAVGSYLAFKIPEPGTRAVARPAAFPNGGFGVVVTMGNGPAGSSRW
jgi:hypothetical protein